jgi:hypothetical protein
MMAPLWAIAGALVIVAIALVISALIVALCRTPHSLEVRTVRETISPDADLFVWPHDNGLVSTPASRHPAPHRATDAERPGCD